MPVYRRDSSVVPAYSSERCLSIAVLGGLGELKTSGSTEFKRALPHQLQVRRGQTPSYNPSLTLRIQASLADHEEPTRLYPSPEPRIVIRKEVVVAHINLPSSPKQLTQPPCGTCR